MDVIVCKIKFVLVFCRAVSFPLSLCEQGKKNFESMIISSNQIFIGALCI